MMTRLKKAFAYLFFLILLIGVCGYGAFLIHIQTLKPVNPEQKTDAIIVLTGGSQRISEGLELYADNLAPQLFISGVHDLVKENEIKAMRRGSKPLPECCITLGHDATTTIGNALEVKKWIKDNDIQSIRLVTSNYHMPRALMEFSLVNDNSELEVVLHPVAGNGTKYFALAFNEYIKVIFRRSVLTLRKQGLLK